MTAQQPDEVTPPLTPTPAPPGGSSGPAPSASSSTQPASLLPAIIGHGLSAGLALVALQKVASWLPSCLEMVRTPAGVSHDPWAWLPLALNLTAIIAIAAPLSLKSVLDFARAFRLPGGR